MRGEMRVGNEMPYTTRTRAGASQPYCYNGICRRQHGDGRLGDVALSGGEWRRTKLLRNERHDLPVVDDSTKHDVRRKQPTLGRSVSSGRESVLGVVASRFGNRRGSWTPTSER